LPFDHACFLRHGRQGKKPGVASLRRSGQGSAPTEQNHKAKSARLKGGRYEGNSQGNDQDNGQRLPR